ncbi:hypothetical protein AQUSIP_17650 [Aquicella siphonis]|uniref:Uncharacterized protein n=1 Tax=Aquicella siphonis TaxID=254247 RepID=A0A5E4PJ97_9COXI|nr:hypothetical protein [Aquicella siphonis]VVC76452.1 hypothetical protein AQUSIP_17650 [Aquicella siphonis]
MDGRSPEKDLFPELSDSINSIYEGMLRQALLIVKESLQKNAPHPDKIINLLHFFNETGFNLSGKVLESQVYPLLYEALIARMEVDREQAEVHSNNLLEMPVQMLSDPGFLNFIQQNSNREKFYYLNLFRLAAAQTITRLDQQVDDPGLIKQILEIPGCLTYLESNESVLYILDEIAMRRSGLAKKKMPDLTVQKVKNKSISQTRIQPLQEGESKKALIPSVSSTSDYLPSRSSSSSSQSVSSNILSSEQEISDHDEEDDFASVQQLYQRWLDSGPARLHDELIQVKSKIEASRDYYLQCGIEETVLEILKDNLLLTAYIHQINQRVASLKESKESVENSSEEIAAVTAAIMKYNKKKFLAIQCRNLVVTLDAIIKNKLTEEAEVKGFIADINKSFKAFGKFRAHYGRYLKLKKTVKKLGGDVLCFSLDGHEKLLDDVVDKLEEELARYPGLKDKIKLGMGGDKQNRPHLVNNLTLLWEMINIHLAAYTRNIETIIYRQLNDLPELQIEFKSFMAGQRAELSEELDAEISLYMSDFHKKKFILSMQKIRSMHDDFYGEKKGFMRLASGMNLAPVLPDSGQVEAKILKTQENVTLFQCQYELMRDFSRIKDKKSKNEKAMKRYLVKLNSNGSKLIERLRDGKPADKKGLSVVSMVRRLSKSHVADNKIRSSSSAVITKQLSTKRNVAPPAELPPVPPAGVRMEKQCDEFLKKIIPLLNKCAGCRDKIEVAIVPIEKGYRQAGTSDLEKMQAQLKVIEENISLIQDHFELLNDRLKINFTEAEAVKLFDNHGNFLRSEIDTLGKFITNPERYFGCLSQYVKINKQLQDYKLRFKKLMATPFNQTEELPSYRVKM